jgi:hypothetical protein
MLLSREPVRPLIRGMAQLRATKVKICMGNFECKLALFVFWHGRSVPAAAKDRRRQGFGGVGSSD